MPPLPLQEGAKPLAFSLAPGRDESHASSPVQGVVKTTPPLQIQAGGKLSPPLKL